MDEPRRHESRQHARHVIAENGRAFVRHYLQDVGSTFGTGALWHPTNGTKGYEYIYRRDKACEASGDLWFLPAAVADHPIQGIQSIGRFEGDTSNRKNGSRAFPRQPILNARADDHFWAARRVMAFSDEMIRAIVKTGQYSDPGRRETPGRRPDQAARQDRTGLPASRESSCGFQAGLVGRADVRECRREGGIRRSSAWRIRSALVSF